MQFRWVALIAVWTILIGPVLGPPPSGSQPASGKPHPSSYLIPKEELAPGAGMPRLLTICSALAYHCRIV